MERLKKLQPMMIIVLISHLFFSCAADQEELLADNIEEVTEVYAEATVYYEKSGDKYAVVYHKNGDKKTFENGKKTGHTKEPAPDPITPPENADKVEIIEGDAWTDEEAIAETTTDNPVSTQDLTGLNDVAFWVEEFDNSWTKEYEYYFPKADSGSPFDIYMLAYAIDANTTMFQVTGDRKYLDRALEYVEAKIAHAKPSSTLPYSSHKDSYLGWSNTDKPNWPQDEVSLGEAHGFRMASTLVRVLHDATDVRAEKNYQERYESLLQFIEVHIWDKWESRGMHNIYRSRTHMASHWARMGMNLFHITGKPKYQKVYQDFYYENPDSYVSVNPLIEAGSTGEYLLWKSHSSNPNFNDISHANAEVALFLESYTLGYSDFTDTQLTKLLNTFEDKIYQLNGPYPFYMDGAGTQDDNSLNEGWFRLGAYSTSIQKKLQDYYEVRRNTTHNKTLQAAVMARNYLILSNQGLAY